MDTQIAIIQFLFKSDWKVLVDSLGANPALNSQKFQTASEVLQFCSSTSSCLVISTVSTKDDLIQLATFVKASRKLQKGPILKIVVVNASQNKQFEKALTKLGSVEILEPNVNVKALRFKLDFWMKAMKAQSKKLGGSFNQKTLEKDQTQESVSAPDYKGFVSAPALDCENDIWLLKKETDCKRIIGRWMVKLMGPGPYVGQWMEVPNKPGVWSFQIRKAFLDQFITGEGNWLFRGEQKPEFNWQENRWMFTGENFELFFYDGKTSQSRVKVANRVNTLAGNSEYARTKEQAIIDSFDKELVVQTDATILKDPTLDFENEGDLGGHLEGKIKDQEARGKGHLEGKVEEEDDLDPGHLEGKVKEQEELSGNLEGKIKDREAHKKGHLEGNVEDSEGGKGPLEGKVKRHSHEESAEKNSKGQIGDEDQREKKHHAQSNEKLPKNWDGKTQKADVGGENSGDKKHAQSNEKLSSTWGGKPHEKQEYGGEEAEESQHKQHNEKLSAQWGGAVKDYSAQEKGKTPSGEVESTDRLKSHWGGKGKPRAASPGQTDGPSTEEPRAGKDREPKSPDSDHEVQAPIKGTASESKGNKSHEAPTANGPDGIGGKSSTDRIASHYSSKKGGEATPADPSKRRNLDPLEARGSGSPLELEVPEGLEDFLDYSEHKKNKNGSTSNSKPAIDHDDDFINGRVEREKIAPSDRNASPKPKSAVPVPNVLPFVNKKEERDLEQLTESGKMTCWITQKGSKSACHLDDYFESAVIFVMERNDLKSDDAASIEVEFEYQNSRTRVQCPGIVTSVDENGTGGYFVTVEVSDEDAKKFDALMIHFRSRQTNITTFLQKARGLA